jgi:hypothetical protein
MQIIFWNYPLIINYCIGTSILLICLVLSRFYGSCEILCCMDPCRIIFILLTFCRKPLFTVKTSTYHFCKMSLVKSSFTQATKSGSTCSASDVEPKRVSSENTECHGVNPTVAPQEHDQCIEPTLNCSCKVRYLFLV